MSSSESIYDYVFIATTHCKPESYGIIEMVTMGLAMK
jgi:hypothetical protein